MSKFSGILKSCPLEYPYHGTWTLVSFELLPFLCFLVELPFLKISFPSWRSWSKSAWVFMIASILVVFAIAIWFTRLAALDGFLFIYLGFFIIATFFIWAPYVFNALNSYLLKNYPEGYPPTRFPGSLFLGAKKLLNDSCSKKMGSRNDFYANKNVKTSEIHGGTAFDQSAPSSKRDTNTINTDNLQPNVLTKISSTEHHCSQSSEVIIAKRKISLQDLDINAQNYYNGAAVKSLNPNITLNKVELSTSKSVDNIINKIIYKPKYLDLPSENPWGRVKCYVHTHHWQIFYILAFFTRFPTTFSRICSGLVLGIYTHGSCAYGFDNTFYPVS
ncbi:hypothetical protein BB561_005249 [Smittium simulii]|uniref:Uncharacterized protein n=1 Tax=Smittium simulii TaxID=133385 RepID=A0A2T9YBC3_9FUNG|nr:hypothetical protein BB561_005249 [Smittium simulii]